MQAENQQLFQANLELGNKVQLNEQLLQQLQQQRQDELVNQQNSLDDEKNQLKLKIEDDMLIIKNKQAEIDKIREEK